MRYEFWDNERKFFISFLHLYTPQYILPYCPYSASDEQYHNMHLCASHYYTLKFYEWIFFCYIIQYIVICTLCRTWTLCTRFNDLTYISTKLCIFSSSRTTQIRLCVSNLTLLGIVYSPEHNRTSWSFIKAKCVLV